MNNEIKKVFFIVNKYSGTGFNTELENLVAQVCREYETQCTIEYTQRRGHATELAREAVAAGFKKVVAVGGDGTVNEVARGLLRSTAAMGILPKGSGNGLARHLKIPIRINEALKCLFSSRQIAIDTFTINQKLSLNVSGIGFDGYIADLFGADKQRGFQGYTKLVLNEFRKFSEFEAVITLDETQLKRNAFVIAIANSSQYGNNAVIAPGASVCDELLDISILKKFPAYRLDFIYSFFSGTIDQSRYCETHKVRSATIRLEKPMSYHVDGEAAGEAQQFSVELLPGSLHMLAPCEGNV